MTRLDQMKVFHLDRALFEADIRRIEEQHDVQLLRESTLVDDRDDAFYPQIPRALRQAARAMSSHYEIFYCVENYIRDLVMERLEAAYGPHWWDEKDVVPPVVKENVAKNVKREQDAVVTPRSSALIDYTTFGELSTIIEANWDTFGDMFNSRKGLVSVLARLNVLRGPIAHCSELSADEVLRLRLTFADWFRLMS